MCTTKVIHIKDAPSNWQKLFNYVYCGRAGKGQDGYCGNPIKRMEICSICHKIHVKAGDTVPCFQIYFNNRIKTDAEYRKRVESLKGKILICFCGVPTCHCYVYVKYLTESNDDHST